MHPLIFYRNFKRTRNLYKSFLLSPEDLVLDVGSGHNPNPRSNVLCDRFLFDHTERNENPAKIDRPMVVGDAGILPFKDKSFDFVICSHLLEHVPEPAKIISELQRVGKRGYIETPSSVWEKIHSFPFHRWYVHKENGVIVFRAKDRPIHDVEIKTWVREFLGNKSIGLDFENKLYDLGTLVKYHWDQDIKVRVERSQNPSPDFVKSKVEKENHSDQPCPNSNKSLGAQLLDYWGSRLRRKSNGRLIDFNDLLRLCICPKCKKDIRIKDDHLSCTQCHKEFEIRTVGELKIPILI